MSKVSSFHYQAIIRAWQRTGWIVVRQRGSHIRLQKHLGNELLKITVPAHRPVKRSTLSHILRQARIDPEQFSALL
ncbi:MAG: type II toxin-antitoxin system HicA family toxin [Thermodesulfobacteriota bacterium]